MPDKPDKDFNMIIGSEFKDAGIKDAEKGAQQVAAATQQAAATSEQAAQKSTNAEAQSTAAATKAAEKQKQLAQMMRLTLMTKKELRAEILRLIAAQKSAAAQNNSKAYEELTASINRAKEALEKLNTAQQVGMIAMQQQAQTGLQFAQGLGSMKEAASQGAAGLATMATQAIALGMAIKAGLGPIGWVMAALQGLGMIVTHFSEQSKKEAEAIKVATKALEEQSAALDKNTAAREKNAAELEIAFGDEEVEKIRAHGKKKLDALREVNEKARLQREKVLLDQRRENEEKRKADAEDVRTGQMSPEEAAAREQERNAKIQAAEKDAEAVAAAEEKKLLEKEKALGPELLAARQKVLDNLTYNLDEGALAQIKVEDKALQMLVQRADEAKARSEQMQQKVDEAKKAWEENKDSQAAEDAYKSAKIAASLAAQEELQLEGELVSQTRFLVEELRRCGRITAQTEAGQAAQAVQIIAGINAAKKGVEEQEAANKALDEKAAQLDLQLESLKDEKNAHEAAAKAASDEADNASTSAALAAEWKEVQQQAQPKRIAWLQEMLEGLEENTALYRQYNEQLKQELKTQETSARQEEWQRVQREKSLADQATWLRDTAAHLEAGSEEAKKWAEQLQGVETRQIQEALGNLEKEFKVTGNYVAEDKRTQRQILLDDKAALQGRAARLQSLISETKDFALRQQLQEKLDETVKQQKALEAATDANAKACRAMLKGYKAPDFHDGNKMVQRNLKQLGHAYERNIKLAEKAAEKGNTNAQERYTRLAGKYAERIARKRKDFAGEHAKNLDALKAAQKKQTKQEEEAAKDSAKNRNRKNKQDSRRTKLDPKESDTNLAPRRQPGDQQLADTKAALKSTQVALADMSSKVADLAATASAIATAATQIAKSAGTSLKTLKKQLKTMQTDIANLWKEVDA